MPIFRNIRSSIKRRLRRSRRTGAPYDITVFSSNSGGAGHGGGGGGGLRTSTITIYKGGTYTITSGAGGAGSTGGPSEVGSSSASQQGGVSSIAGPKVTTYESAGGGVGGDASPRTNASHGGNGGAGGGAWNNGPGGSGNILLYPHHKEPTAVDRAHIQAATEVAAEAHQDQLVQEVHNT